MKRPGKRRWGGGLSTVDETWWVQRGAFILSEKEITSWGSCWGSWCGHCREIRQEWGEFKVSAEWGWRKQKRMEGEAWEGESESLGVEMVEEDSSSSMWRPMAGRQLIHRCSRPRQGDCSLGEIHAQDVRIAMFSPPRTLFRFWNIAILIS